MPLNHIHKMVKVVNIILWAFHTKNEGAAHLFTCLSEYQIPFLLPPPLTCPGSFLFPAFSKLTLWPWALLGWRILHLQPHMLSFLALGRGIYPRALCAARATDLHQDVEWGTLTSGKMLRMSELCYQHKWKKEIQLSSVSGNSWYIRAGNQLWNSSSPSHTSSFLSWEQGR